MKQVKHLFAAALAMLATGAWAQIVTTTPPLVQEDTPGVVFTYHADSPLGNNGLKGLPASEQVYVHIGAITTESKNNSDWKYVPTEWPKADGSNAQAANIDKNHLTYVSANTYSLNMGSLRSYFGITDPNEHIKKVAMVFRTADGKKEGKTTSGGDIYFDVMEPGFAMEFTCTNGKTIISAPTTLNFALYTTNPANLSISVNGVAKASQNNATSLTFSNNFTSRGSVTLTATAVYGGKTYTKNIVVAYPSKSTPKNYPGGVPKMGTVKNSDGTVTFCFAAPGKEDASIVPSWDNYNVLDANTMFYQDYNNVRYFWITVKGLQDNVWYPYYYLVDATYKVADPYANLILDNYSDKWLDPTIWPDMPQYPYEQFDDTMLAVYRGDLNGTYKFSNFTIPSHDNLVVYELLLRDFTGTDGEALGNGTVRQAIAKIPYLKNLGVNCVELMPIMEFNGNNSWGYNTNFYFAPDKAYGSPTDYKDFVEACHQAGMAVVLDIVFNQSDGLHPWYQMYPIESNPFYNKVAPHDYSVLNDWNQGNALVEQQWTDCLKYWMQNYNVDGFRFDLVKGLGDNNSYSGGTDTYNSSRVARMTRLHKVITSVKANGIHINEDLAGDKEEIELGNDGQLQWSNINGNSCQFAMGFNEAANLGLNITQFLSTKAGNRPWGSTVSYAESHDEERMAYKATAYGTAQAKIKTNLIHRLGSMAVQMLLTPGPKMIWMFGELGADQTTKNESGNDTDPKFVLWHRLKDQEYQDLRFTYGAMNYLRLTNPELFAQDAQFATSGIGGSIASARTMRLTKGSKEVMAFINGAPAGAARNIAGTSTILNANNCQLIAASSGYTPRLTGTGTNVSVTIPPHCYAVFATKTVDGVEDPEITIDNDRAQAYGADGEIVILGDYNNVQVYNLAGQQQAGLRVAPGLYIVNIDGRVSKVSVR